MAESFKKLRSIFSPLEPQLLADGPRPSIDIIKGFEAFSLADPNALYIGQVSQMPEGAASMTCALVRDIPLAESAARGNNILLFPPEVQLSDLFDKAEKYIVRRSLNSRKAGAIMDSYMKKEFDVAAIINIASKELDRELLLYDPGLRALSGSGGAGAEPEDGYMEFGDLGESPSRGGAPYNEENRWRVSDHGLAFYVRAQEYGEHDMMVIIEHRGKLIAYLLIKSGGRPFDFWDEELIGTITEVTAAKLTGVAEPTSPSGYPYELFIAALLEDSAENRTKIRDSANLFGIDLQGYYCLLLVNISRFQKKLKGTHALRDALTEMAGGGYSVIYRDDMVILMRYGSEREYHEQSMGRIAQHLRQNKLYGTRSKLFFRLDEAHKHYAKAKKLLALYFCAPEDRYFISIEDMGLFPIMDTILRTEDIEDILEPIVVKLSEIDRKKRTSYVETLYTYLKCFKNQASSYKQLFIHRNTLDYRIQKITELTGIDWNDGDLLIRLYLSIHMLKFKQSKDKNQQT